MGRPRHNQICFPENGSIWISEAPGLMAFLIIRLTRRITGASLDISFR